jgi:hypothetical protein
MKSKALATVQRYFPNVTKVVDAKRSQIITVTAEDCKQAKRKAPDACALATACERSYDGALISMSVAYLIKGDKAERFKVPNAISREIVSFDRHKDFAPGDYFLNAPSAGFRLGPRDHPQPKKKRKGYAAIKARYHHTAGIRSLSQEATA